MSRGNPGTASPVGLPAVDPQTVVRLLSSRIAALTIENAMLQARVLELEAQLRAVSGKEMAGAKGGGVKK